MDYFKEFFNIITNLNIKPNRVDFNNKNKE